MRLADLDKENNISYPSWGTVAWLGWHSSQNRGRFPPVDIPLGRATLGFQICIENVLPRLIFYPERHKIKCQIHRSVLQQFKKQAEAFWFWFVGYFELCINLIQIRREGNKRSHREYKCGEAPSEELSKNYSSTDIYLSDSREEHINSMFFNK